MFLYCGYREVIMLSFKKYIVPVLVLLLALTACSNDATPTSTADPSQPPATLPFNPSSHSSVQTTAPSEAVTAEPTTEELPADYPFEPVTSGIYVTRDGGIKSAELTDFDNSAFETARYSEAELKLFVQSRVKAYNEAKQQEAITVDLLQVKDKIAELILNYATFDDFMTFQGSDFGVRSLTLLTRENAIRNYDIRDLKDPSGSSVDLLTALRQSDLHVLAISGRVHVTVNGNITALSEGLILTGVNSVRCDSDQAVSFIIFR